MKVDIFDIVNMKKVADKDIGEVASIDVSPRMIAQYKVYCDAHAHSPVRALCKNRALMERYSAKPYAQKGSGRARHGDRKANLFRHGAKAHGPNGELRAIPTLNKKFRKSVIKSVIVSMLESGNMCIYQNVNYKFGDAFSYSSFVSSLPSKKCLFLVDDSFSSDYIKQVRNCSSISLVDMNYYHFSDLTNNDKVFVHESFLDRILGGSDA